MIVTLIVQATVCETVKPRPVFACVAAKNPWGTLTCSAAVFHCKVVAVVFLLFNVTLVSRIQVSSFYMCKIQ